MKQLPAFISKFVRTAQQLMAALTVFEQDIVADKKSIFISRHLSALSPILIRLNSMGYQVQHEALVKTSPIRFTHTPASQWIFFPGRDAMRHFFSQEPQLKRGVKFAVVSSVSADYLQQFGYEASFVGTGVDVERIGKDFARFIGDASVLIPQALDSMQVIQKQLSFTNSCHNLFVYKSQARNDLQLQKAALLVFTSPANVQAYFDSFRLLPGQNVVALGSSTATKLKDVGCKHLLISEGFEEAALLETILRALNTAPAEHQNT